MKKFFKLLPLFLLASCGQSKFSTVTLITGLENHAPLPDVMKRMSSPRMLAAGDLPASFCAQQNLFAGIKFGSSDSDINTYPIDLATAFQAAAPTDESTWLSTAGNSTFTPIKLQVTNGTTVDFGIVGSIIASTGADANGVCLPVDASTSQVNPSYSVIGHKTAPISGNTLVPINVWVLNAASTPSPISATGGPDCNGNGASGDLLSQSCPAHDFYTYTCIGCPGAVKFEYIFGANQLATGPHATQWVSNSAISSASGVSIPSMDHLIVTLMDSAQAPLVSKTIDSSSLSTTSPTTNFPFTFTGGSATLTLSRPNRNVMTFTYSAGGPVNFAHPNGIALDHFGNLFVADTDNHVIRKITPGGTVSIFAGMIDNAASDNGSLSTTPPASFDAPTGIAFNNAIGTADYGSLYVTDTGNNNIRKITPEGMVSTIAGIAASGAGYNGGGLASNTKFNSPSAIVVDGAGTVYVADTGNHLIRKIYLTGAQLMVGDVAGYPNAPGYLDGSSSSKFNNPSGIALDPTGTHLLVADTGNHSIRVITLGSTLTVGTLAGGAPPETTPSAGSNDGPGTATVVGGVHAQFNSPKGITVDYQGNIFVADTGNQTIRRISFTAVGTPPMVTTLAGIAGITGALDGIPITSTFSSPAGIVVGNSGEVYVVDTGNSKIRIIH